MTISKFKLGWTAFCGFINPFGSMVGNIVDYLLEVLNSALAALSDTTKEKIDQTLAVATNVMNILLKLQWLVPTKWQYAFRETVDAVQTLIDALQDLNLTADELAKIKKEFQEAVDAWKNDDPAVFGSVIGIAILGFAFAAISGCATTGEQPARSQTQKNDFTKCIIVIAAKASVCPDATGTNSVVSADGGVLPGVEIFTQTQANDGSETNGQTASPTNETKPSATVPMQSGASSLGGAVGNLINAGISAFGNSDTDGTTNATTANSACSDGSCYPNDENCQGGVCSPL